MMRNFLRAFAVVLLASGIVWAAGHYAPHGLRYIPQKTTQGTTDYTQIVANETATDLLLYTLNLGYGTLTTDVTVLQNKSVLFKTLGDAGYETLAAAITTAGSTPITLTVPVGTWASSGLTTPATMSLQFRDGVISTGSTTTTILGSIDAGHKQIFSWTGSGRVDISGSPTKVCLFDWWGPQAGITNTVTAQLLKAYQSCGSQQQIVIGKGLWRLATTMTYVPAAGWTVGAGDEIWLCSLVGEDPLESVLYIDVGAANDGISIGGVISSYTRWIDGAKIENLNIVGPANACRHALNLACWNAFGGTKNVNLTIGSTDYAVRLAQQENSLHDFILGYYNAWLEDNSIAYGYMKNGIEYEPEPGGTGLGAGTFGELRVRKSSSWGGTRAVYFNTVGNIIMEEGDIENCFYGDVVGFPFLDYITTPASDHRIALYSGATTRAAQTFTLASTTSIRNVGFCLAEVGDYPRGPVVAKIYATSGGTPTGSAVATSHTVQAASNVNGGGAFQYVFDFLPVPSLAAGTYAVSVEYSGGDSSHYIQVDGNLDSPTDPGTCYTYDGSWHAQTMDLRFAVNVNPAIEVYNSSRVRIKAQHCEGNWIDLKVDKCSEVSVDNTNVGGSIIDISRSKNITFTGTSEARILKIDPVSSVDLGHVVFPTNVFGMEDAGNSLYLGRMRDWVNNPAPGQRGNSLANLMPNHLLSRWEALNPAGLAIDANTTCTQVGVGLVDTTHHNAPYCAKIEVTDNAQETFSIPAEVLASCLGENVIFSIQLNFPSSQAWGNNSHLIQLIPTFPTWAASTSYNIGDAVYENSTMFVCVMAGTSGTAPNEPDWTASYGYNQSYVDDNTVRWLRWDDYGSLNGGTIDDSVSDDKWHRWSTNTYVPHNATALDINFYIKVQADASPTTVYMAEPTLNLGFVPTRSVQPAANETATYIQVGKNRLTIGASGGEPTSPAPIQGDLYWIDNVSGSTTTVLEYHNGTSWVSIAKTP